jgi:hypothetical protein
MEDTERLRSIEKAVLAVCYLWDQVSDTRIPASEVLEIIADKTNVPPTRLGFGRLRSEELIATYNGPGQTRQYAITDEGRELVESSINTDGELAAIFEAIDGPLDPDREVPSAPASDRTVSIAHNSSAFLQLESGIVATLEAIRKVNDLDKEDEMVAAELRASLEIIKAPQVSAELVERVLIKSLRYFADKFVDNAVGMAAGAALALAIQFFGFG